MAKENKTSFWGKVGKFFKRLGFKIVKFFVNVFQEMRRVRWPGKKVLVSSTCIVLSVVFLFGIYVIFDDFIIAQVFKLIY